MEFEIIDIEWEGSFPISYNRNSDLYSLDLIPPELLDMSGFYQIYGRHPVYGKDALLYIGETKKGQSGQRGFRERFKEHFSPDRRFFSHTNLSVHIGPCDLNGEIIKKAESILIHSHAPALNRQNIDGPIPGSEKLMIRNWSFLGDLQNVCIGKWNK